MLRFRPSPLIVSESAVAKLPRWILLVLLATFALAGFSGHYFWNGRDELVFSLMAGMAGGSAADFFLPVIGTVPYTAAGPGAAWIGALLLKFAPSWIDSFTLARIPALICFAIAAGSVWLAALTLARRDDAQPAAPVFNDAVNPADYSRTIADCAVLFFTATFGILSRLHEIGLPAVLLATQAAVLLGLSLSVSRPKTGAALAGLAAGSTVLFANLCWTAVFSIEILLVTAAVQAIRRHAASVLSAAVLTGAAAAAVWPAAAFAAGISLEEWKAAFLLVQQKAFAAPSSGSAVWLFRNFIWYLFPVWPFAFYAVYAWRRVLSQTPVALLLAACAAAFSAVCFSAASPEYTLTVMTAPAAVLAAFGLASVKRHFLKNFLDWFSSTIFTLAAAGLWAYYAAWVWGFPPKMAASLKRLAPSAVPWTEGTLLFACATVTVLWVLLVVWRLRKHPKVLWRGPLIAAAGITLLWILGTSLFSKMLDVNRSYYPVAREIAGKLQIFGYHGRECVTPDGLPLNLQGLILRQRVRFGAEGDVCRMTVSRLDEGDAVPADSVGIPTEYLKNSERFVIRTGDSVPMLHPKLRTTEAENQ